jgi:hypothetical protein
MRTPEEESLHSRLVQEIAKRSFNYPDERSPELITIVNHPAPSAYVRSPESDLAPDIVVLNANTKFASAVAEVETISTVTEQESDEWKKLSLACNNLFIYVPEEKAADAQKMLAAKETTYSALIAYKLSEGGKMTLKRIAAFPGNIYGKARK